MADTSTAAPTEAPDPTDLPPPPGERPSLAAHLPGPDDAPLRDPDEILDRFVDWVTEVGFELYPAQEEALLELLGGRHVILATPTGSGKSLVALGLHFKALCEGRRSFYTSPIKALASEKFFALCEDLGAERVGMLTGDASINPDAPVICCTAEVLANMALRQAEELDAPYVVMDEFHYYSDRERGVAWQIPLVNLPHTRFLLMSATLGDTSAIEGHLAEQTDFEPVVVSSTERPVPLDFEYREVPLHETVTELVEKGKAPVYIVNFTQRECAELAQSLTSMQIASRETRDEIRDALRGAHLDTPYGKEFRRFLSFGIGVHHAGLLPKYRLLVEQLAQQGLLKVICGTDTLGVGVNIPIRTVLFSALAKFDGTKMGILSIRDFQQIAGRAGRKGFDDEGSVVVQAPEHIIEKRQIEAKAGSKKELRKMLSKRKGQAKGEISWTEETYEKLVGSSPETLESRFKVSHGMLVELLQRDAELDDPSRRNFQSLRTLIDRSHEDDGTKTRLVNHAAVLARSLYRSGVIKMVQDTDSDYRWVVVDQDLQWDFSLFQALSLYLVETIPLLHPEDPDYAFDLLTLVEAVLEDPRIVLIRQENKAKTDAINQWKAEGVEYDERMERLEEITHPKPQAEFLYGSFRNFREANPWVGGLDVKPKSIGREMFEGYYGFADYVRRYGLQRSEGVLLRYLSQLYKTLDQTVPDHAKTEPVWDALGFFRTILERTDSSLIDTWETLVDPELHTKRRDTGPTEAPWIQDLLGDRKAFAARVRSELHLFVRALSERDFAQAADLLGTGDEEPADGGPVWDERALEEALEPFFEEYDELVFTPEARRHQHTQIREAGPRQWEVTQTLLDPQGDNLWAVQGRIDLRVPGSIEDPLVRLERIGL